jgi:hypothetical protein
MAVHLGTLLAFSISRVRQRPKSTEVDLCMSQRDANMLCLRDTLEHLSVHQQRLEWTEDAEAIHVLTENMIRDLIRCQRLCETLRRRCSLEHAA